MPYYKEPTSPPEKLAPTAEEKAFRLGRLITNPIPEEWDATTDKTQTVLQSDFTPEELFATLIPYAQGSFLGELPPDALVPLRRVAKAFALQLEDSDKLNSFVTSQNKEDTAKLLETIVLKDFSPEAKNDLTKAISLLSPSPSSISPSES